MSSGSQISDQRTYIATRSANPSSFALVGSYFSRVWGGGDRAIGESKRTEHDYSCTILQTFSALHTFDRTIMYQQGGDTVSLTDGLGESISPLPFLSPIWGNNDDLNVLGKLGNLARDNKFNGSNFLAELHQPIRMIAAGSEALAAIMYGLRKGDFQKAKEYAAILADGGLLDPVRNKTIKKLNKHMTPQSGKQFVSDLRSTLIDPTAMAERVLVVQYGIRPLLRDMHDSAQAIGSFVERDPDLDTVYRAKRRLTRKALTHDQNINTFQVSKIFVEIRAQLKAKLTLNTLLHLNDPLSAALEVTPWSFVLDWALPVSSYLNALDTVRSMEWGSAWRSMYSTELSQHSNSSSSSVIQKAMITWPAIGSSRKVVRVERHPINISASSYLPPLPSYKSGIVPEHWLNGAALLLAAKTTIGKTLKY